MRSSLTAAAGAVALAGCTAVGPDYRPPAPGVTAGENLLGAASPAFTGDEPPGRWWRLFDDPALDRLGEQALAANKGASRAPPRPPGLMLTLAAPAGSSRAKAQEFRRIRSI